MTLLTASRLTLIPPAPLADRYDTHHRTTCIGTCLGIAQAMEAVATHHPNGAAALDRALEADPHLVATYALRGLEQVILVFPETIAAAPAMTGAESRRRSTEAFPGPHLAHIWWSGRHSAGLAIRPRV